jgi:hypothetical protein
MQAGGGAAAFSPLDIPGLQLWLDASQIVGLNDGDPVTTWSDLSGNGYDATQATASKKPLYKTNIKNGRPCVLSDGVDDALYSSVVSTHPFTIYAVVYAAANVGADHSFLTDGDSGGARRNVCTFGDGSVPNAAKMSIYNGAGPIYSANALTATWCVVAWVQNGASTKVYVNGTEEISGNSGTDSINGLTLMNRYTLDVSLDGYVGEFALYQGAHGTSDRQAIQNYLSSRWGI